MKRQRGLSQYDWGRYFPTTVIMGVCVGCLALPVVGTSVKGEKEKHRYAYGSVNPGWRFRRDPVNHRRVVLCKNCAERMKIG